MTDQIKPASDEEIGRYQQMCKEGHPYGPLVFAVIVVAELIARIDELKAQLAAQEQSHKDILQSVGEEATRQIAELTKDQEDWRKGVGFISACLGLDTLSTVDLGERALEIRAAIAEKDKRIAELEKAVDVLGWQCDKHRGRIAELEAVLSGGAK